MSTAWHFAAVSLVSASLGVAGAVGAAAYLWPEPPPVVEREGAVLREVVVRLSVAPPDKARTVYLCSPEVKHRRKP